MPRSSTRTNAMRKMLRLLALTAAEFATTGGVSIGNVPHVPITDQDAKALKTLAAELRERAAGHKGKAIK